jgi:hypothetical protein
MEKIEIDLTDPTLPDNYLQLQAALERDCAKYDAKSKAGQMGAKKGPKRSYQTGLAFVLEWDGPGGPES